MDPSLRVRLGLARDEAGRRDERAAMARIAVYLLACGGTLGLVSLLLPGDPGRNRTASLAIALSAYAVATVPLVGFTRLPLAAFHLLAGVGTAAVTAGVHFGGDSAVVYALFYFWVALYVAYFFTRRGAALHLVAIVAAYAVPLGLGHQGLTPLIWLVTAGTSRWRWRSSACSGSAWTPSSARRGRPASGCAR